MLGALMSNELEEKGMWEVWLKRKCKRLNDYILWVTFWEKLVPDSPSPLLHILSDVLNQGTCVIFDNNAT